MTKVPTTERLSFRSPDAKPPYALRPLAERMEPKDCPAPKLAQLRNLYEGGVEYNTAIQMVGYDDTPVIRDAWRIFGRLFNRP